MKHIFKAFFCVKAFLNRLRNCCSVTHDFKLLPRLRKKKLCLYIYIYFSDGRFCCFFFFIYSFVRCFRSFSFYLYMYTYKEQFVFGTHILCAKKFAKRERSNRKQNGMKRITNIYHFGVVFFHLDQLTKIYHCFLFLDFEPKLKLKLDSAPFCCLYGCNHSLLIATATRY